MRLLLTTIGAALIPVSVALAVTSSTVSFQNGINGYTGTFDRYINDGSAFPGVAETNGSAVTSYALSGYNQSPTSPAVASGDSQGLIRFDNIFGSAAGQIPVGATILDAELTLTTAGGVATNPTGQSVAGTPNPGSTNPFGVSGLLTPFSASTSYFPSYPPADPGDPFGGRGPYYTQGYSTRPVGAFGLATVGQIVSAPITSLVQQWSNSTLANNGLAVQAGFQQGVNDDWQILTTGNATAAQRPKLSVTYTTDPIATNTFQPGVNGYDPSNVTMARVVGTSPTVTTPVTVDGSTITTTAGLDGPDATTAEQLALVKFNSIFGSGAGQAPADKPVAKAWLVITTGTSDTARTNDPYDVDVMRVPWNTSTLYTQLGATPGLQFSDGDITPTIARNSAATNGGQVWFDVTNYVESIRNGATDNGLSIRPRVTDGWSIAFNGSTDASLRPELVVESQLTSGGLQGDFDNNGKVDASDYVVWRKGVLVASTPANYNLWRANFGATGSATPAAKPSTLANYDMIGLTTTTIPTTQPASQVATGLTSLPVSRGAGLTGSGLTNGFAAADWTVGNGTSTPLPSLTLAQTNGDYFQFGVATDSSHTASLSTLDLSLRKSAVGAPKNYELEASLDGFASAGHVISDFTYFGHTSGNAPDPNPLATNPYAYMSADGPGRPNATTSDGDPIPTVDLTLFSFLQNLPANTTVTFRLYAWGDSTTAATNTVALGRMEGPRITGFVTSLSGFGAETAVPEPSSALLLGIFGLVIGAYRRRQR